MRGPPATPRRSGARTPPSNEANTVPTTMPTAYTGWNARGNLANMAPTDAIQLDNIFPDVQNVRLRPGCIDWKTACPANIKTLIAYNGGLTEKLFAATNTAIYDATTAGAFGASVTTCTNGQWSYVNFVTPGGRFVILANGTDAVKSYDGAAWANPAITVATPSTLSYVTSHQKRLWFIEGGTMSAWYLPVSSIAGAATLFPLGEIFKRGGTLVALGSWTIDSGTGADDFFVAVTSNGELAVYQGTDPASSTTWALVGVYDLPRPLGNRPFADFGGDLLYLSKNGLIPLSKLVQSVAIDRSQQVSYKIDGAFIDAAATYASTLGWSMITSKTANLLIVNIPVAADVQSYQFVMNTVNGAWCRFLGWNAMTWATLGDSLYFAGGTKVSKAWTGTSDAGVAITGTLVQAYAKLNRYGQKNVTLARPNIGLTANAQITMSLDADFKTFAGRTSIPYTTSLGTGIWDTSLWDAGIWDAGSQVLESLWQTIPGEPGYLHSFRLQITTTTSSFIHTSTDYAIRPLGIL